jgi:plastocyanin
VRCSVQQSSHFSVHLLQHQFSYIKERCPSPHTASHTQSINPPCNMFSNTNLLASAALLSLAGAAKHIVDVGKNGLLEFSPNSTTANVGDIVEFHYYPKNHSVVQTSFASPCQFSLASPFFSGFMPTTSGEAVSQSNTNVMNPTRIFVRSDLTPFSLMFSK